MKQKEIKLRYDSPVFTGKWIERWGILEGFSGDLSEKLARFLRGIDSETGHSGDISGDSSANSLEIYRGKFALFPIGNGFGNGVIWEASPRLLRGVE